MSGTGRTAVVLAAGFGSRLEGVSEETRLKPLTPVAGQPLLLRTFAGLHDAGCEHIVVVVGHGAEEVQEAVAGAYHGSADLRFVVNPRFELANGVSLLAARPFVKGPFLLTMADHVFSEDVMQLAAAHTPPEEGATLLVDYDIENVFDLDDATKVLEQDGRIVEIGKQIPRYNCIDTGLFVCTPGLIDAIQHVFEVKGDASLSDGVSRLAREGRMTVLDIGVGFWQDVDTPEMLAEAERRLTGS